VSNPLKKQEELNPIHCFQAAHLSGVDSVHLTQLNDSICIVSGGDDQQIFCAEGRIQKGEISHIRVKRICTRHSGAIKGIKISGQFVFAVGQDQILSLWRLGVTPQAFSLIFLADTVSDVSMVMGLSVRRLSDTQYLVLLCGHGLQTMKVDVRSNSLQTTNSEPNF